MTENAVVKEIADAAFLAYELRQRGLGPPATGSPGSVCEHAHRRGDFRADLIVEDKVIVEIKSVEVLAPVHKKQLLTYLRLR